MLISSENVTKYIEVHTRYRFVWVRKVSIHLKGAFSAPQFVSVLFLFFKQVCVNEDINTLKRG